MFRASSVYDSISSYIFSGQCLTACGRNMRLAQHDLKLPRICERGFKGQSLNFWYLPAPFVLLCDQ